MQRSEIPLCVWAGWERHCVLSQSMAFHLHGVPTGGWIEACEQITKEELLYSTFQQSIIPIKSQIT